MPRQESRTAWSRNRIRDRVNSGGRWRLLGHIGAIDARTYRFSETNIRASFTFGVGRRSKPAESGIRRSCSLLRVTRRRRNRRALKLLHTFATTPAVGGVGL